MLNRGVRAEATRVDPTKSRRRAQTHPPPQGQRYIGCERKRLWAKKGKHHGTIPAEEILATLKPLFPTNGWP